MSKLDKFTLKFDKENGKWKLAKDSNKKTMRYFETKADATSGGTLRKALGIEGGSVKIMKKHEKGIQEERTFPKSKDPKRSKG